MVQIDSEVCRVRVAGQAVGVRTAKSTGRLVLSPAASTYFDHQPLSAAGAKIPQYGLNVVRLDDGWDVAESGGGLVGGIEELSTSPSVKKVAVGERSPLELSSPWWGEGLTGGDVTVAALLAADQEGLSRRMVFAPTRIASSPAGTSSTRSKCSWFERSRRRSMASSM